MVWGQCGHKAYSLGDFCAQQDIGKISLLKIDIEGGEYEVMSAFSSEAWEKIENVFLEYHDLQPRDHESLKKILQNNGFRIKITTSSFVNDLGFIFAWRET